MSLANRAVVADNGAATGQAPEPRVPYMNSFPKKLLPSTRTGLELGHAYPTREQRSGAIPRLAKAIALELAGS